MQKLLKYSIYQKI